MWHQSGTQNIKLIELKHDEFIYFANKVVGYVHQHLAQKPQGDGLKTLALLTIKILPRRVSID